MLLFFKSDMISEEDLNEIIKAGDCNDYVYVTFTDDSLSENIISKVAQAYPNYISIEREVKHTESIHNFRKIFELEKLNPIDIVKLTKLLKIWIV